MNVLQRQVKPLEGAGSQQQLMGDEVGVLVDFDQVAALNPGVGVAAGKERIKPLEGGGIGVIAAEVGVAMTEAGRPGCIPKGVAQLPPSAVDR